MTAALGEAAATAPATTPPVWSFDSVLAEYRERPHAGRAADLLTVASVYAERDARLLDVAKDVAENAKGTPLGELAEGFLEGDQERHNRSFEPEPIDSRKRLHRLREILIREPRNAIRWVDLAREHLILGQPERARRAITVALQLAPNDRFVLRAATAFFVHQDATDDARSLLERAPRTRHDPWLLASLVAVEDLAKTRQRSGRHALRLLDGDFPDAQLAELAAALGTVELSAGSERRARQLLRRSVVAANENALAQVEWLSILRNRVFAETSPELVPRAFEASARRAESEGRWEASIAATRLWIVDQPFSAEAAIFGSFAACESRDWETCREFVEAGRQSNPDSPTLLNNLAFAEVGAGNFREAVSALERARKLAGAADQRLTLAATEALLLFRIGMVDLGRRRYDTVIRAFAKAHDREHAAKAALMLAQEEAVARSEKLDEAWKRADHLAADLTHAHVRQLHERIARMVSGGAPPARDYPRVERGVLERLAEPLLTEPAVFSDEQT